MMRNSLTQKRTKGGRKESLISSNFQIQVGKLHLVSRPGSNLLWLVPLLSGSVCMCSYRVAVSACLLNFGAPMGFFHFVISLNLSDQAGRGSAGLRFPEPGGFPR